MDASAAEKGDAVDSKAEEPQKAVEKHQPETENNDDRLSDRERTNAEKSLKRKTITKPSLKQQVTTFVRGDQTEQQARNIFDETAEAEGRGNKMTRQQSPQQRTRPGKIPQQCAKIDPVQESGRKN